MRMVFRVIGWFAKYSCGCFSETVPTQKDVADKCATHGALPLHVLPISEALDLGDYHGHPYPPPPLERPRKE
jgi:hypothetical protein